REEDRARARVPDRAEARARLVDERADPALPGAGPGLAGHVEERLAALREHHRAGPAGPVVDEPVRERVLPDREARAARAPGVDRLGVGTRARGDPVEE